MAVKFETNGDTLSAYIIGDIDHHQAQDIRKQIDEKIMSVRPKKLILNFGGVDFMDSSGIAVVLGRHRLMQSIGGTAAVTGVKKQIYKIFKLSGVDKIMQITGEE